jgi:stearoyl-CoA desaturase (delta-9 desaturase)
LEWWQFDSSWLVIRTMQMLGLAWNVKVPPQRILDARRVSKK